MQCLAQRQTAKAGCSRPAAATLVPVSPSTLHRPAFSRISTAVESRRTVLTRVAESTELMDENELIRGVDPAEQAEMLKLPKGYHWYETMLILTPALNDEDRDRELAKFEAFLNKEECLSINALVRGRSRMAYPMQTEHWEGIYVLYTYAARRQTARTIQLMLSNPEVGSENVLMRHMTLCKY